MTATEYGTVVPNPTSFPIRLRHACGSGKKGWPASDIEPSKSRPISTAPSAFPYRSPRRGRGEPAIGGISKSLNYEGFR
jgi:hypothetical protein